MVKSLSEMLDTWVWSLGWKDPGEGHGNSLQYSWMRIPWIEEAGGLQSTGSQKAGHNWANNTFTFLYKPISSLLWWAFPCINFLSESLTDSALTLGGQLSSHLIPEMQYQKGPSLGSSQVAALLKVTMLPEPSPVSAWITSCSPSSLLTHRLPSKVPLMVLLEIKLHPIPQLLCFIFFHSIYL